MYQSRAFLIRRARLPHQKPLFTAVRCSWSDAWTPANSGIFPISLPHPPPRDERCSVCSPKTNAQILRAWTKDRQTCRDRYASFLFSIFIEYDFARYISRCDLFVSREKAKETALNIRVSLPHFSFLRVSFEVAEGKLCHRAVYNGKIVAIRCYDSGRDTPYLAIERHTERTERKAKTCSTRTYVRAARADRL